MIFECQENRVILDRRITLSLHARRMNNFFVVLFLSFKIFPHGPSTLIINQHYNRISTVKINHDPDLIHETSMVNIKSLSYT